MKEFSLGDILGALRGKFSKGSSSKEKIATIVSAVVGETISSVDISLQGKTLFVRISPILKNELFYKKELCLKALKEEGFFLEDIR